MVSPKLMPEFNLSIPTIAGDPLEIELKTGDVLFALGANGSGKSSLMLHVYQSHKDRARKIAAHRRTWFTSNATDLSPEARRNTEVNLKNLDKGLDSRWKDDMAAQRTSIAIYDLVHAENVRHREISQALTKGDVKKAKEDAPIGVINGLLRLSGIPIEISLGEGEELLASKNGREPLFSIARLSDGERNALLIAASVLTVPTGTLIIIDEPERHLHRSIISPLLTELFSRRADCTFIVSTHEVLLPADNPKSQTVLVREVKYSGQAPEAWGLDLVVDASDIDEDLRTDILGARRNILFVEGEKKRSLNLPIYDILFPGVSVIPRATGREVANATKGLRNAENLHWVHAAGLVDGDGRTEAQKAKLLDDGVFTLPFFSVEAIYYLPSIMTRLAQKQSDLTGDDATGKSEKAIEAVLKAIGPHKKRLAKRAVEQSVRATVMSQLPKWRNFAKKLEIGLDIPAIVKTEVEAIEALIADRDLQTIICRYPLRDTPALDRVATKLGFQGRKQYEKAVRKLLLDDPNVVKEIRSPLGPVLAEFGVSDE
ncbi:AAA family ATPase [Rhodothermus sp. AH-315-K08]|nr:AAA family ATPase [Rhodothermus sp. AH-315-K08]